MGIETDGGMIIGRMGCDIPMKDGVDIDEWADENDITYMSLVYDAQLYDRVYGFLVEDVWATNIEGEWLTQVKELAVKFEELTGVPALLMGSQDVW
ncbi:MAG: hypothetical protein DRQ46_09420 [Gammaproteobacteria bacterium]|nr:MAG: hypothetical protein DRQ46_09420 [Gammaproteobacteria bacterium]